MTRVLAARASFVCASTHVVHCVQMQEAPFVRENRAGHCCRIRRQDQRKKRVWYTGSGYTGEGQRKHGRGGEGPREGRKAGDSSQ